VERVHGAWTRRRSRVHGGPGGDADRCTMEHRWRMAHGALGATRHRSSSALAEEYEGPAARASVGSPKEERRHYDRESWWRLELDTRALEGGGVLESEVRKGGVGRGSSGVYLRGQWGTGEG
jgi:hypothetical protein